MEALDLFRKMNLAVEKPETKTANTMIQSPIDPGAIGVALPTNINQLPKQVMARLATEFPVEGLEPEQRAQLNMAAKLTAKAAEDAKFFTAKADAIGGDMATIHTANVEHLGNMLQHDIKVKEADVKHLGNVETWQSKTLTLTERAREKHAGINLLQLAL